MRFYPRAPGGYPYLCPVCFGLLQYDPHGFADCTSCDLRISVEVLLEPDKYLLGLGEHLEQQQRAGSLE